MIYYLIIGAYIILYLGMIAYDLWHKDPQTAPPKVAEEEIDISQEAKDFHPVEISKDMPELQVPVKKRKPKPKLAEQQPKPEAQSDETSPESKQPKEEQAEEAATEYSGARMYEELKEEIEDFSANDPEVRQSMYEIMKVDGVEM